MSDLRIVRIDPGTDHAGVAVLEVNGKKIRIVQVATMNRKKPKESVGKFLHALFEMVQKIFHDRFDMSNEVIAVEDTYTFVKGGKMNAHPQQMLERCVGVMQMAAAMRGAEFKQARACHWKRLAAGNGTAQLELIRLCMQQQSDVPLTGASEHAVCACGIGYAVAQEILHKELTK